MCGTMCDVCWQSGGTCAVSGSSRDVRGTQPSVSVWFIYIYMHTCMHTYLSIYMYIYMSIYLYMYICIHMYMYTYAYVYICICIYIRVCIYVHTHTHTQTHTHIYVYIWYCFLRFHVRSPRQLQRESRKKRGQYLKYMINKYTHTSIFTNCVLL